MLLVSWLSQRVRLPGTDFAAEDMKKNILQYCLISNRTVETSLNI